MRNDSMRIKNGDKVTLQLAIESKRFCVIKRAMKDLPSCAFVAEIGGETCEHLVVKVLLRLLPDFSSCQAAFHKYTNSSMRACVLNAARAVAVGEEEISWILKARRPEPSFRKRQALKSFNKILQKKT